MSKFYTIAVVPKDCDSNLSPYIQLAQSIRDFGHKCVLIINEDVKRDSLHETGVDYICYGLKERQMSIRFGDRFHDDILRQSPYEKIRSFSALTYRAHYEVSRLTYTALKRAIDSVKPDAIVVDNVSYNPAVVCAGVPWIRFITCNPLFLTCDERLPPMSSGLSMNSDKTVWDEFREEWEVVSEGVRTEFNTWLISMGAPPIEEKGMFCNPSPYLNLYLYPEELDYKEIADKDKTFVSFDPMLGNNGDNEKHMFELPEKLRNGTGKLIYVSLGRGLYESANCALNKRLVSLLSDSEHRFIVVKGRKGDEYELPENMWGENWLPQTRVLPLVDLVLTHGGNNTFNESLFFGKPMIVFPLFADQYDNAQRLVDRGLGARLDPYECTRKQLFEAMDSLLNDSELYAKYKNISQRMKDSKSGQKCAKLITKLITEYNK